VIGGLGRWCKRTAASSRAGWRRRRHRRLLASLSEGQLADAGIDRTEAGRGRAIAGRSDPSFDTMW